MRKIKKIIMIGLVVSLVSQVYINMFITDFRISFSVIVFSTFLLLYKELNVIKTSVTTGAIVFLFRTVFSISLGEGIVFSIINYYPVIIFYFVYGVIFNILKLKDNKGILYLSIGLIISDFLSNIFEIILRYPKIDYKNILNIIAILFLVGLIRSAITLIIINLLKFYKLFIIKSEHEERYKNLLITVANLNSEIYLIKKNTNYIEKVMKNSYELYEEISKEHKDEKLEELSLNIAKDVHEIKKDYLRVIKGMEGLFVEKIDYNIMNLKDIFKILEDSTLKFLKDKKMDVNLTFNISRDFKTKKHYQLISILRNLINNSIEGIDDKKNICNIKVVHLEDVDNHILEVIDNGIGIRESDLNYVFTPGYSTKFNRDTGDIYRGLGLTYVKDIVSKYFKGKVVLESKVNEGSKFKIIIPKKYVEVEN